MTTVKVLPPPSQLFRLLERENTFSRNGKGTDPKHPFFGFPWNNFCFNVYLQQLHSPSLFHWQLRFLGIYKSVVQLGCWERKPSELCWGKWEPLLDTSRFCFVKQLTSDSATYGTGGYCGSKVPLFPYDRGWSDPSYSRGLYKCNPLSGLPRNGPWKVKFVGEFYHMIFLIGNSFWSSVFEGNLLRCR